MKKTAWVVVFLLLFHCGGRQGFSPKLDPEDRFTSARRYMEMGKYTKAQEEFKRLMFEHPGSDYVDDAQYYLAESHFLSREYDLAVLEYEFLIDNYKGSPYVDEACFKVGSCYYNLSRSFRLDQSNTKKALDEFELFLAKYPQSEYVEEVLDAKKKCLEKLARKGVAAGELYMKLRKFRAARVYFENVVEEYPDAQAGDRALFLIGTSYEKEGDMSNAREAYERVLSDSDDETIISQAEARLEKLVE